jgi:transcriptional antiterminator RfaH
MGFKWYAARTEPRAEFLAANELVRDGFQVCFPLIKALQPRKGHDQDPLFPGYLFLRCDPEIEGWPSFRPAHRLLGWVNFEGDIPSLPDGVVDELQERSAAINRDGGLWRRFRVGELVHVVSGSLECLAEVVKETTSPQARVQVLMGFMGRLVRAQVPWETLQPAGDQLKRTPRLERRTRGRGRLINRARTQAAVSG